MPPPGYVSLLYSIGRRPLENWSKHYSQSGRVWKTLDSDLLENVVELQDLQRSNNSNTFIICPAQAQQLLDIRLPFLVIIIKNMNVECRFRVQVLDTNQNRHHFYFSNELFDSDTAIKTPVISRVHVKLEAGWNRVEIDLDDLTQRLFNSRYKATQRLAICANCRLRRIYFVNRHYGDVEMSAELCRAFFDHYLIKRGLQEKTSTRITWNKAGNHAQFLRDLQNKSATLINDFFNRTRTRLDNVFDFRSKMGLMFLAIPRIGDQGTLERVYSRKSNCGLSRSIAPIRNGTSLKSTARHKQRETVPDTTETVTIIKRTQGGFKSVRKGRKQQKQLLENCEMSFSRERGFSTIPKIVLGRSTVKNQVVGRPKDAMNNLEVSLNDFLEISDPQKSKKQRKGTIMQNRFCNWDEPKMPTLEDASAESITNDFSQKKLLRTLGRKATRGRESCRSCFRRTL